MLVDSETNSIYALRKDLLKYFKNPEEAKNLGLMSEKKIKLVCPDCGHGTEMMVQNFTRRGFYCKYCKKDGVSFPNKILRGLLKQLKFEWDVEVGFDWSKNYKYDGYLKIKDKQYLIEMHGMQHYKDTSFSTVEFQAERDQEKRSLAEQNGFVEIEIDCHFSSFELVRENLEKSFLSEIINFSGISWEKVYEEVGNNYVKMAADMYNKRQKITEIASKMKLARHTIRGYLKDASCIGWCNYDKK